jgi:Holliday junction resolvase-like predicted endonuclease
MEERAQYGAGAWKEKMLELWVLNNLSALEEAAWGWLGTNECTQVHLLGSQVRCKYGVIDALMTTNNNYDLWIVEFKAVQADEATVGQLQRYAAAAKELNIYDALTAEDRECSPGYCHEVEINPFLVAIAPSFTVNALAGLNIAIQAEWDGVEFSLNLMENTRQDKTEGDLASVLGGYMRSLYRAEYNRTQKLLRGGR